ncbi:malonyl-ACP O-methyltransferase BioC [Desulfosporosinus metallidurans]|uniref:Malonyl-[acyl-carrier protein] O-methyltransferase n=1 Tax=Desulfosporosinus metallidurans TaxID=1888891 RepID=A0A1Q8R394_9FIRM|nr:malonyl-ACP O-methyltransferase BioC [Desulfosporosinus metallidurans]OLN34047.1 Biotin synthesis protein BioC [Desulfosporosinus metallidurans]
MTINKAQVQKNFGRNAVTYDQYAVVQKEMARELLLKIKRNGRCFRNILEIGCGTGFLTELLAKEYPLAQITATDIAPEMIVVAREKLAVFSNIKYFVADGENLSMVDNVSFDSSFDLIVSNAVFQWFTDYAEAFTQYYSYLEPGGYLIFSTLGTGTFKELYVCLKDGQKGKLPRKLGNYKTHKKREPFIENQYLQEVMKNIGFHFMGVEEVTKMEYFDSCRCFLRALKMIGAHNYLTEELTVQGLGSGIFSIIKRYDAMFFSEQGVPVTYQCLFGWGRRTT